MARTSSAPNVARGAGLGVGAPAHVILPMPAQSRADQAVLIVNGFDGRAMYASYLRYHGYRVVEAPDPRSAMPLLRRFHPLVVVTDFVFPTGHLDGPDFIDVIHQDHVPAPCVIVVSGFTRPIDQQRARDTGADAFLIKPCSPDRLLGEIERLLGWLAPRRPPDQTAGRRGAAGDGWRESLPDVALSSKY